MTDKEKIAKIISDNQYDFKMFLNIKEASNGKRSKFVSFFVDDYIAKSAIDLSTGFKKPEMYVFCVAIPKDLFDKL